MKTILKTENLQKHYVNGDNITKALDDVNIEVEQGEFIAIIGSSGSGKSTLLHMLGGLDNATSGKVFIDNKDLMTMDENEKTIFRRSNIGFIFQNFNLIPILNVYENIVLPLQLDGKKINETFIKEILNFLGIEEKKLSLPTNLSGGQQQRVAIARAIAMKPKLVLADEPTGNLDSKASKNVITILKNASVKFGQTVLIITHSMDIAKQADRIIQIEDGKVLDGESNEK